MLNLTKATTADLEDYDMSLLSLLQSNLSRLHVGTICLSHPCYGAPEFVFLKDAPVEAISALDKMLIETEVVDRVQQLKDDYGFEVCVVYDYEDAYRNMDRPIFITKDSVMKVEV